MISNLSSLIQLFATIYLTMSLDNEFLVHFWAPNYFTKIDEAFESFDLPQEAKQVAISSTTPIAKSFEKRMMKRGIFMFVISVFLLIIIGFEKGLVAHTGYLGLSCSYILFAIITICFFFYDRVFLEGPLYGYSRVSFFLAFYVFLILLVPYSAWYGSFWMQFSFEFKVVAKVLIVIAIVLPVIWQLFVNWLYSYYFSTYVIPKLSKEVDEYKKALRFDVIHDDVKDLKTCYQELIIQRLTAQSEDLSIELFLKEFKNEVSKIDFYPVYPKLLLIVNKELHKEKVKSKKSK